jgi:PilZ domain-containing protein
MSPAERKHVRIQYPTAARPSLLVDGQACEVLDISEGGVRFRVGDDVALEVGDAISGRVRFQRTAAVDVKGTVLRIVGREVAARLDVGVPLKAVIEEQRYLREVHR